MYIDLIAVLEAILSRQTRRKISMFMWDTDIKVTCENLEFNADTEFCEL